MESQLVRLLCALVVVAAPLASQAGVNWSSLGYGANQDVTIAAGVTVLMNVSNPLPVKRLTLQQGTATTPGGRLIFNPIPVQLACHEIMVENKASFEIGTAANPAAGPVVITLLRHTPPSGPVERGQFMVMPGGTLELHGANRGDYACWTELEEGASAQARDVTVRVMHPLAWQSGDQIVIASTDFQKVITAGNPDVMLDQTEEFTIDGVTQAGTTQILALHGGLVYDHTGVTVADSIEERAEVGLLNRSIRIQGDQSGSGNVPGHVMLGDFATSAYRVPATAHIEWTEFTNLGGLDPTTGAPVLNFYPLHFHQLGVVTGSYVRNCSLHHNHNNNLVIHTTDNLLVDGNVLYDTVGWHVWLQTSKNSQNNHVPTVNNVITNNLALLARDNGKLEQLPNPPTSVLDSAACFYITSFQNEIRGNHAGSSEASGFYCDTREAYGAGEFKTWLKYHPNPTFVDNVAHACGNSGFWLDGYTEFKREDPKFPSQTYAQFHNFTAYKNNAFGFHCRNFGGVEWIDSQLADNGAGLYLASAGYWLEQYLAIGVLSGGRIVGESAENLGYTLTNPEISYGRSLPSRRDHNTFFHIAGYPAQLCAPELTGVSVYDGLVHTEGVEFRGFEESATHTSFRGHSGAFSPAAYPNPWAVDPRNLAKSCTFVPPSPATAVNRVWFREYVLTPAYPNGANNVILNDQDGSILGSGSGGGVVYPDANPVLNTVAATGVSTDWNSSFKYSSHPFAQVILFGFAPWNYLSTVTLGTAQETLGPKLIPVINTFTGSQQTETDLGVFMHPWNTPVAAPLTLPPQRNVMSSNTNEGLSGRITLLFTANAAGSVADFEIPYTHANPAALSVAVAATYADAKYAVFSAADVVAHTTFAAWQGWTPSAPPSTIRASYFYDSAASRLYLRGVLRAPGGTPPTSGPYLRGGMFAGQPIYVCIK